MQDISAAEWEDNQAKLGGHFLQSDAWAQFQQAMGRRVIRQVHQSGNWSMQCLVMEAAGFRYLYAPYGPTFHGQAAEPHLWRPQVIGEQQPDFLRVEPMGNITAATLRTMGAVPSTELNPAHTAVIDLTLTEEELRHNLTAGHRNAINGAERRGLSFREGKADEIKVLIGLIKQTGRRKGFSPHPDSYYRAMAEVLMPLGAAKLYLAEAEGKAVAASIVFDYRGQRIYAHAAADPASRKLQAAVPLVWHMVLEAKATGMSSFDLWGVAPMEAGPNHPWAGFSQFKRAFGGQEVEHAGTWDLPLKPLKYRAYLAARTFNRWVRR